jgi:hypothetical protein
MLRSSCGSIQGSGCVCANLDRIGRGRDATRCHVRAYFGRGAMTRMPADFGIKRRGSAREQAARLGAGDTRGCAAASDRGPPAQAPSGPRLHPERRES